MTEKRKFEIVYDTELPGTPERAWEAVTKDTPAWMFPTDQWPAVRTVDSVQHHGTVLDTTAHRPQFVQCPAERHRTMA